MTIQSIQIQLKMGGCMVSPEENKDEISICTLNYCGIGVSPFEFYNKEFQADLKSISAIFVKLIHKYFPNQDMKTFKWNIGKIDQKIIGRYTPCHSLQCGIKDNKFLSRAEFETQWDKVYAAKAYDLKFDQTPDHIKCARLYDFICFHALLQHVYSLEQFDKLIKNNVDAYVAKYGPMFKQSFLSEELKIKKMIKFIEKAPTHEVIFLQEYTEGLIKEIRKHGQYFIVNNNSQDLAILIKKSIADKLKNNTQTVKQQLGANTLEQLNWDADVCMIALDNYLFICGHLSSKAEKNPLSIQKMRSSLLEVKKKLVEYEIIVGCDANSFFGQIPGGKLSVFPTDKTQPTSVKKRTMMQAQYNKGDVQVSDSKDTIVTTLGIIEDKSRIMTISGLPVNKQILLPSDEHPFDHYMITVTCFK